MPRSLSGGVRRRPSHGDSRCPCPINAVGGAPGGLSATVRSARLARGALVAPMHRSSGRSDGMCPTTGNRPRRVADTGGVDARAQPWPPDRAEHWRTDRAPSGTSLRAGDPQCSTPQVGRARRSSPRHSGLRPLRQAILIAAFMASIIVVRPAPRTPPARCPHVAGADRCLGSQTTQRRSRSTTAKGVLRIRATKLRASSSYTVTLYKGIAAG
jgi:hypothetical protein